MKNKKENEDLIPSRVQRKQRRGGNEDESMKRFIFFTRK